MLFRVRYYANVNAKQNNNNVRIKQLKPISNRVDRASATEVVDWGSIPGRVEPKTIKIGIHSFPALRSANKGAV